MPALQLIALDTTTPQLRAPASGDTYSAPRALDITPETLTGSSATSSLSIAQTWNTTGTPTAIDLNVTDTASNSDSSLLSLRIGAVVVARFRKNGELMWQNSAANQGGTLRTLGPFLPNTGYVSWGSTAVAHSGAGDLYLYRDAANTLAQRNGVNAQAFNIYNTYTDASNYERLSVSYVSNQARITSSALGTGTVRDLGLYVGSSMQFYASSGVVAVAAGGANTDTRWFSGAMYPQTTNVTDIGTSTFGWKHLFQTGYHEMIEMTAPAAPATNRVRIYAEDNGSGKTRLMALFATGVAQQLAVEP